MRDLRILKHLHEIATAVPRVGSGKLAAAVVYKRDIVSIGINQYKTHPLQKQFSKNPGKINLHAEIHALSRAVRVLNESEFGLCSIYVARSKKGPDRGDVFGMALPCSGCMACLQSFGIKKVCYTNDHGGFEWI